MPPLFNQFFWPLVGDCVTKSVLDFLNLGVAPPNFNETNIILIPKIKNPSLMTNFRPISFCNVMYKLASKTLANHMKSVLSSIVSENQSAYTKGHFIMDNVLVAFEIMHHISQKCNGKVSDMALKLDMSKAYDRVEWVCFENIMLRLGFQRSWWIRSCHVYHLWFILYVLMGNLVVVLSLLGVFAKETLFLHTCFCFVQKGFQPCCGVPQKGV